MSIVLLLATLILMFIMGRDTGYNQGYKKGYQDAIDGMKKVRNRK
jgi:hypothetical protein